MWSNAELLVTMHVSLDDGIRGMIEVDQLKMMKLDSVLINTAREGLVDEISLLNGLKNRKLAAAAFEVLAQEPPEEFD